MNNLGHRVLGFVGIPWVREEGYRPGFRSDLTSLVILPSTCPVAAYFR